MGSLDDLRGAALNVNNGGLAIDNPNTPDPKTTSAAPVESGSLQERVATVLKRTGWFSDEDLPASEPVETEKEVEAG